MTSLGFRKDNDHIAERQRQPRTSNQMSNETSTDVAKRNAACLCTFGVPRGLIPTLAYSATAFLIPILFLYMSYDFTDEVTRGVTIGVAAIAATAIVYANCCCCWFNMVLFFHAAVEVRVVNTALTFAYADDTSDKDMALAIVGASIVIAHLVPFLLIDNVTPLAILAYAGVVLNAAINVYLDSSRLLLVGGTSAALLGSVMVIGGICEVKTSMLSLIRESIVARKCITCDGFEL